MSSKIQALIRSTTVGFLSLGIAFCASPALGSTLTRQDFSGNFTLVQSPNFGGSFPETTEYSGFVSYDENNSLLDWEVNVEELSLSLNPDSNDFGSIQDVTFDLSSEDNWNLRIDFGIAFDTPLYTLQRDSAEINFSQSTFGGTLSYSDSAADINVTSSTTPVPEPSTIFASLAFLSTITMIKRKSPSS